MWIGNLLSVMMLPSSVMSSAQWSLIQARSAVTDSIGTVSSMDEALAFVQDLAEKVVGHNVPLTDTEKKAVDTIQAYVRRMLEDIKKQRNEDQNEVNRYRAVVQGCADTAKEALDGSVTNLRMQADGARELHAKCRKEEGDQSTTTSTQCSKYDAYRSTPPGSIPPKCMESLSSSDIATTDAATKKSMEQCITAINAWVLPLYDLYIKCKQSMDDHLDETKRCDGKQSSFESDFCQYSTMLVGTCSSQTSCRSKNIQHLHDGDEEVGIAEKARQADCEVGHKIDCLLKIFEESDNTKKPGLLDECKKLKPSCPDKIEYPPIPGPTPCTEEASEPCDDAWLQQEYTSQTWYALAPTKPCHACSAPHPCTATLYESGGFQGWKATLTPGDWNTRALERAGAKDDHASAIEVDEGCEAVVFENPDLTGKKGVFAAGKYDHSEFVKIFPNDKVSSMRVGKGGLEYLGCLASPGWSRPVGDVPTTSAGIQQCRDGCQARGFSKFGFECPMGTKVHCQCANSESGRVVSDSKCDGGWVRVHCTGPFKVEGPGGTTYLMGAADHGSVYTV